MARKYGKTKWNYFKLAELAWIGITNYSNFPIRFILFGGIILILISSMLIIWGQITGNHSNLHLLLLSMSLFSGLIIFSIGILGEYISKILYEVKGRPRFQIESTKNL